MSLDEQDWATWNMMQWFVKEQTEEETLALNKAGFRVICWNSAPEEHHASEDVIESRVEHADRPGAVILFHDHTHNTIKALPSILRHLRNTPVTLPQLFGQ